jgi:hypothetical protein
MGGIPCVYTSISSSLYSNYLQAIDLNVHVRVPTLEIAGSDNFMYSSDRIGLDPIQKLMFVLTKLLITYRQIVKLVSKSKTIYLK